MTVAWFLNLKETIALSGADHALLNTDMKALPEIFAQLFGEFGRVVGNEINVLAHARLADIGVDRPRAEHNGIVAPAQKLEHGVVDCRQWQLFAHGKLLEGKSSGVEHRLT